MEKSPFISQGFVFTGKTVNDVNKQINRKIMELSRYLIIHTIDHSIVDHRESFNDTTLKNPKGDVQGSLIVLTSGRIKDL